MKVIAWTDLQGRYRVTSPAYGWLMRPRVNFIQLTDPNNTDVFLEIPIDDTWTEDDSINWTWTVLIEAGGYGIPVDHTIFLVEDADQRARLTECCGTYFRYGVKMLPNREGLRDEDGKLILTRDARDGAWEMDVDGMPTVNIARAAGVQMDYIRVERDKQLGVLDDLQGRAIGRGDDVERGRLETEKQVLRDLPANFDLSIHSTPETLKAAWPAELPARER